MIKLILIVALLTFTVVGSGTGAWWLFSRYVLPALPELTHEVAIERTENAAKLITVQYYMTDIFDYSNPQMWPFTDQKVLVIAKARVSGGFNLLSKPFTVIVNEPEKRVDIRLPRPEILAIDPTYSYYDIQGSPPPEAHTYILNEAKFKLRSVALQAGILDDTRKSAHTQLSQLFPGYQITVTFDDERTNSNPADVLN